MVLSENFTKNAQKSWFSPAKIGIFGKIGWFSRPFLGGGLFSIEIHENHNMYACEQIISMALPAHPFVTPTEIALRDRKPSAESVKANLNRQTNKVGFISSMNNFELFVIGNGCMLGVACEPFISMALASKPTCNIDRNRLTRPFDMTSEIV